MKKDTEPEGQPPSNEDNPPEKRRWFHLTLGSYRERKAARRFHVLATAAIRRGHVRDLGFNTVNHSHGGAPDDDD